MNRQTLRTVMQFCHIAHPYSRPRNFHRFHAFGCKSISAPKSDCINSLLKAITIGLMHNPLRTHIVMWCWITTGAKRSNDDVTLRWAPHTHRHTLSARTHTPAMSSAYTQGHARTHISSHAMPKERVMKQEGRGMSSACCACMFMVPCDRLASHQEVLPSNTQYFHNTCALDSPQPWAG